MSAALGWRRPGGSSASCRVSVRPSNETVLAGISMPPLHVTPVVMTDRAGTAWRGPAAGRPGWKRGARPASEPGL